MATKPTASTTSASTASDEPTQAATTTTPVTVQVQGAVVEPKPVQGLQADAKAAQAQNIKDDEANAAEHQELRDNGKIVTPIPLTGYEQARVDLYVPAAEKINPDPAAEELAK
jgi:cytochrome oxidase assembly protein ShyY1